MDLNGSDTEVAVVTVGPEAACGVVATTVSSVDRDFVARKNPCGTSGHSSCDYSPAGTTNSNEKDVA